MITRKRWKEEEEEKTEPKNAGQSPKILDRKQNYWKQPAKNNKCYDRNNGNHNNRYIYMYVYTVTLTIIIETLVYM